MVGRRSLIVAGVAAAIAVQTIAAAGRKDPPTLAFGRGLGSVTLDMPEKDVLASYGQPDRTQTVKQPTGRTVRRVTYTVRGGKLVLTYFRGRVKVVDGSSRRYRTPTGFGVGSLIPRTACTKNRYGGCDHRYRGFTYDECAGWVKESPRGVVNLLYGRGNVNGASNFRADGKFPVRGVLIGYANFALLCF